MDFEKLQPSVYSRSLHDTMYLFALSLNKSISMNGPSLDLIRNGTYMRSFSKGKFNGRKTMHEPVTNSSGLTGNVQLNDLGNREPIFYLTALDPSYEPTVYMSISIAANIVVSFAFILYYFNLCLRLSTSSTRTSLPQFGLFVKGLHLCISRSVDILARNAPKV